VVDVSIPLTSFVPASPLKGPAMLVTAIAVVAAPTLIRFAIDPGQGDGFCAYVPFVVLAAIALEWRVAAVVAAASGLLAASLFEGVRGELFEAQCEIISFIFFGLASALVIGLAQTFRKAVAEPLRFRATRPASNGLVFSREAGQACVSWHGGQSFVPLGPADEVEVMMRDFLAQQEVGRRLRREKDRG
jgi:hypothetical protein